MFCITEIQFYIYISLKKDQDYTLNKSGQVILNKNAERQT